MVDISEPEYPSGKALAMERNRPTYATKGTTNTTGLEQVDSYSVQSMRASGQGLANTCEDTEASTKNRSPDKSRL